MPNTPRRNASSSGSNPDSTGGNPEDPDYQEGREPESV